MAIQAQTKLISGTNIFEILITTIFTRSKPPVYTPSDFGYEIEETELAEELAAHIPEQATEQPAQINPNEFETTFNWFLS
jgi:hypothetical protein